jgi:hypothetical protein
MDKKKKKVIYLRIDTDLLKAIDEKRVTEHGVIPRSTFLNQLLREVLLEVKS